MKDTTERNWIPGNSMLGIESRLKDPAPIVPKELPPMEAIIGIVQQYLVSVEAGDGGFLKRILNDGRVELTGPGVYMTLLPHLFDEVESFIKSYQPETEIHPYNHVQ